MELKVDWKKQGLVFEGHTHGGFHFQVASGSEEAEEHRAFRPLELMALSLASCTGMDVLSILQKKRQNVADFAVRVETHRQKEHPRVWTEAHVEYLITGTNIDPAAVERAIELSSTKYCPASNMLNKALEIKHSYQIFPAPPA